MILAHSMDPTRCTEKQRDLFNQDFKFQVCFSVLAVVMICSCSDETLCHIGDGGNSTSHGVCRLIDNRGID
jgi:hypothetical protein